MLAESERGEFMSDISISTSGKLYVKNQYFKAMPSAIGGELGCTMCQFINAIMVGLKMGNSGLEIVNQCSPVVFFMGTFGYMICQGSMFISSLRLGENNKKEANRVFNAAIDLCLVVAFFFSVLGSLFSPQIAAFLASDQNAAGVTDYIRVLFPAAVTIILAYLPVGFLQLVGKYKESTTVVAVTGITTTVLSWAFIFPMDLGLKGAALATAMANFAGCVIGIWYLTSGMTPFHFDVHTLKISDITGFVRYGIREALGEGTQAVAVLLTNKILIASQIPGANTIYAVVNTLRGLLYCVDGGIALTGTAIRGIFYGEKDYPLLRKMLNLELNTAHLVAGATAVLIVIFRNYIPALLGSDVNAEVGLSCFAAALIIASFNNIYSNYFNTIGRNSLASVIVILRKLVFCVAFCWLFWKLGITIWLFYPAADVATFLTILAVGHFLNGNKEKYYMLDTETEKQMQNYYMTVPLGREQEAKDELARLSDVAEISTSESKRITEAAMNLLSLIHEPGGTEINLRLCVTPDDLLLSLRYLGDKEAIPTQAELDQAVDGLQGKARYSEAWGFHSLLFEGERSGT